MVDLPLNVKCYFSIFLIIGTFSKVKADDGPCINGGGTCQENNLLCNWQYQSGLCGGGITRQCCLPAPDGCSTEVKSIACKIMNTPKIKLLTSNPFGMPNGADPFSNIQDACNGRPVKQSEYICNEGKSPGGVVCLKASILNFIYDLGTSTEYNFQVNAIAGACHTSSSNLNLGQAVDLQLDRLPHGRDKGQEKAFMDACTDAGGWTHGGTHVHCEIDKHDDDDDDEHDDDHDESHVESTASHWKANVILNILVTTAVVRHFV